MEQIRSRYGDGIVQARYWSIFRIYIFLSYYPFTARYKRDNLCCYQTTDKCTPRNTWYGGNGRQIQRVLEHSDP